MTDDARKPGLEAPSRWALTSAPRPISTTTPQGPATARCRSRDVSYASDLMGLDDSSVVLPPLVDVASCLEDVPTSLHQTRWTYSSGDRHAWSLASKAWLRSVHRFRRACACRLPHRWNVCKSSPETRL
ncbi:hypothetical protein CTRI78_v008888 [Colletotrichum trifolii]|uniref:Uncharacterized protein n=1 Tax=Colletotrichum trifolii TaxID=5466 RepID=A0A4R8QS67_COLTR|nr:hypothetical protein CTRI78_v008888 [Colletotrichum trifolii]